MKKATSAFIKLLSHHINIELGKESVYEINIYHRDVCPYLTE